MPELCNLQTSLQAESCDYLGGQNIANAEGHHLAEAGSAIVHPHLRNPHEGSPDQSPESFEHFLRITRWSNSPPAARRNSLAHDSTEFTYGEISFVLGFCPKKFFRRGPAGARGVFELTSALAATGIEMTGLTVELAASGGVFPVDLDPIDRLTAD